MPAHSSNRLAGETSPYLRQHAANPVAWQPWDAAALAAARRDDRPILLSIGYSACHWCHVMAHESFEDEATAAVLNRLFVCIKVDREERPDLDQIYQTAHQMLTGRAGGWPLTMFLTPDGMPFFGGTYFPRAPRHGLPAFADLCERVAGLLRERRGDIERQNVSLREALERTQPHTGDGDVAAADVLLDARAQWLSGFDREHGGFGGAPKFPHPGELAFLLRQAEAGDAEAGEAVRLTLSRMAAGGIYDQIGGGFSRYSVDERWEIPHFEKMLYDNGLLLGLYADAWRHFRDPRFLDVVTGTAGWLMDEMQAPAGGYWAALDADSEGEEGRFYVWQREEARSLLTDAEWRVAAAHWGFAGPPNFEGLHWHARVVASLAAGDAPVLATAKAKLKAARDQRVRPGLDDKVLVAWNGLAIAGMMRAARICGQGDWQASARRALDFVQAHCWREGRLYTAGHLDAYLDDYAFLLAALLEAMQTRFRATDLEFAVALADALCTRFEDADAGGFFFTAHDHEQLIHRPKPGYDNATPAGNGIAAWALQRLGHLLGATEYLETARRTLKLFTPQLHGQPIASASLLWALAESATPPSTVLLRGPDHEVEHWQARLAASWSGMALALPNDLAGLPPVLAKPTSDRVNAWVCQGVSCLAPVDTFENLSRIILRPS